MTTLGCSGTGAAGVCVHDVRPGSQAARHPVLHRGLQVVAMQVRRQLHCQLNCQLSSQLSSQ